MTRSEHKTKERIWLKIRKFAITKSLMARLEAETWLTDKESEYLCYIQNQVLRLSRKNPWKFVNVGAEYFEDKIGGRYRRWINLLIEWGELEINKDPETGKERYSDGSDGTKPFTKSYTVPLFAWASGQTTINFKRRATPVKDHTDWATADDITRYVHRCCSRLTVPKTLVSITDPIRDAAAHEFSRRVYWGDFRVRYGDNGKRMYHSIIEMPNVARAKLVWKENDWRPLFEYDIKSCHPVLLLPLFSDPWEWARFAVVLKNDVYTTIRDVLGIVADRDEMKIQFVICTNSIDKYVTSSRGLVYRFFQEHFPIFTREVLDLRSDLAAYLQQQESEIMVQALGRFCLERNFFWIPCHDGWLGTEDGEAEMVKKVGEEFWKATGYAVQVERTGLQDGTSITIILGEGGGCQSYVPIEGTISPSEVKKSAMEWFASLPKHPVPDAETLKKAQEARENRKQALCDHQRRGREADELRQKGKKALSLWRELMGGDAEAASD